MSGASSCDVSPAFSGSATAGIDPTAVAVGPETAALTSRLRNAPTSSIVLGHAIKLETARWSVAASLSHSALGAAATTTALEPRPDTRHAISR